MSVESLDLGVEYQVHMQNIGWGPWVKNGELAGTVDKSIQIEAIRARLINKGGRNIILTGQAHQQDHGWLGFVGEGEIIGIIGKGLSLQACQFALRGDDAAEYAAQYQMANVQDIGPMDWVTNEEQAGTVQGNLRAEAFKMMITKAGVNLGSSNFDGFKVMPKPAPPAPAPNPGTSAVGSGNVGVFFSPSKQPDNIYTISGISEQDYCEDLIANYIIPELESRGGRGYTNNGAGVLNGGRNAYSNQLYADGDISFSMPIHTNAGGGNGCEVFCNPDPSSIGYQLSERVLNNITALGRPSRGLKNAEAVDLFEYGVDAPVAYTEIDYHDSVAGCNFLLGKRKEIAIAFVNAIYAQANA